MNLHPLSKWVEMQVIKDHLEKTFFFLSLYVPKYPIDYLNFCAACKFWNILAMEGIPTTH